MVKCTPRMLGLCIRLTGYCSVSVTAARTYKQRQAVQAENCLWGYPVGSITCAYPGVCQEGCKEKEDVVSGKCRELQHARRCAAALHCGLVCWDLCVPLTVFLLTCAVRRKNEKITQKANILHNIKNKPQPPAQLFSGIYSYTVGACPVTLC